MCVRLRRLCQICNCLRRVGQRWRRPCRRGGRSAALRTGGRTGTRCSSRARGCWAACSFGHQDRVNTWDWLAQLCVQLYNLLVLGASYVCGVGIAASASDIAELTSKSIASPSCWTTCPCFHACLLLLVLLSLQVFLVGLRPCARYLANLTIMKLLRFGRYSRSFEHPTTLLLNPRRTCWLHSSPLTNFRCPSCGDNVDCRRRLRLNINIWFCCRCDSRGKLTRLWIGEDGGRVGGGWHCCVLVGVRRRRGVGCAAAVRRSVRWCWDI